MKSKNAGTTDSLAVLPEITPCKDQHFIIPVQ